MEHATVSGKSLSHGSQGFTLLELMIVVSIIGILALITEPAYHATIKKSRETALRQDLFVLRDLLDQHRGDRGRYPTSLDDLVATGYLRTVRVDPFTGSIGTWQMIPEPSEGGIYDVHSGSPLIGTNSVPYNEW